MTWYFVSGLGAAALLLETGVRTLWRACDRRSIRSAHSTPNDHTPIQRRNLETVSPGKMAGLTYWSVIAFGMEGNGMTLQLTRVVDAALMLLWRHITDYDRSISLTVLYI